jgi:hypothetical protein
MIWAHANLILILLRLLGLSAGRSAGGGWDGLNVVQIENKPSESEGLD